jgi:hypothetical protein
VGLSPERLAENNSRFREANERIGAVAGEQALHRNVPFICECADTSCVELVRMSLAEYERVRARATVFLVASGHGEEGENCRLVEDRGSYQLYEKVGRAGELAAERDPRAS